jgi:hypothetical protein
VQCSKWFGKIELRTTNLTFTVDKQGRQLGQAKSDNKEVRVSRGKKDLTCIYDPKRKKLLLFWVPTNEHFDLHYVHSN